MHRWLDFVGGLFVGFGLAAYAVTAAIIYMLNRMFVIGISQRYITVLLLSLPAFSILFGIAVVTIRRRRTAA